MLVAPRTLVLCQAGGVEGRLKPPHLCFSCAHEKQDGGHEPSPPFSSTTFSLKAQKHPCEWPFIISRQDWERGLPPFCLLTSSFELGAVREVRMRDGDSPSVPSPT